jgi:hypothetical protein
MFYVCDGMKTDAHTLKGNGYLISILSVFLLALPPLKSARDEPLVLACIADRKTQHKIDRKENKGDAERGGREAQAA